MENDLRLIVKTSIGKEDYKNFLYKTTFFKNKYAIPSMFLLSGLMASFVSQGYYTSGVLYFFVSWVFLLGIMLFTIVFKIERKYKMRVNSDRAGTFDSTDKLEFYDEFIIINSPKFSGVLTIRYDQIYKVIEQKDYFLTYFNATQSSMIRKKDMNDELTNRLRALYKEKLKDRYREVWY